MVCFLWPPFLIRATGTRVCYIDLCWAIVELTVHCRKVAVFDLCLTKCRLLMHCSDSGTASDRAVKATSQCICTHVAGEANMISNSHTFSKYLGHKFHVVDKSIHLQKFDHTIVISKYDLITSWFDFSQSGKRTNAPRHLSRVSTSGHFGAWLTLSNCVWEQVEISCQEWSIDFNQIDLLDCKWVWSLAYANR